MSPKKDNKTSASDLAQGTLDIGIDNPPLNQQNRRKSDDWFRLLLEAMGEGACIADETDRVVVLNSRLAGILRLTQNEVIGRSLTTLFPGIDDCPGRVIARHEIAAHVESCEIRLTRSDGSQALLKVSPRPFFDGHRSFRGTLAVVNDVTENRRAQQEILRLTATIEQNPVGVLMTDRDGTIDYVNPRLCLQTGYTAQELLGTNPRVLKSGDTPPETFQQLWAALSHGSEWSGRLCDRKKTGETYWAYEVIFPIRNPDGETTHFVGFQEDITDRVQAERSLRESEAKYSTLVESSLTGIYVIQDERLIYVNRKLAELFGYTPEELQGMAFGNLVHPSQRESLTARWTAQSAAEEEECSHLLKGVRKDGQVIYCRKVCSPIEFGGREALLGNLMDVTREQLLTQQVTESHEKLQRMTERLLDVEEREKKRVAADLHDSIGQYLNTLRMGLQGIDFSICGGAKQRGQIEPCVELRALTEEAIEEVRRIAADLRPAMLDDLGILATIKWFCRRTRSLHPGLSVESTLEADEAAIPEPLKIVIYRVLQEALSNAAKYAEADTLTVRLTRSPEHLELEVTDNGRGFDPANTVRDPAQPNGFGLLSMRERVTLSRGNFSIQSSPGSGTRITACWDL